MRYLINYLTKQFSRVFRLWYIYNPEFHLNYLCLSTLKGCSVLGTETTLSHELGNAVPNGFFGTKKAN